MKRFAITMILVALSVQMFPSSVHGVSAAVKHVPVSSSQVSAHSAPPVQGGKPGVHTLPRHVSAPSQKRPFSHCVPSASIGWMQLPAPSHWSAEHSLPSSVQLVPAVSEGCAQAPAPSTIAAFSRMPS